MLHPGPGETAEVPGFSCEHLVYRETTAFSAWFCVFRATRLALAR
jgi:hypothetical protein